MKSGRAWGLSWKKFQFFMHTINILFFFLKIFKIVSDFFVHWISIGSVVITGLQKERITANGIRHMDVGMFFQRFVLIGSLLSPIPDGFWPSLQIFFIFINLYY